MSAVWLSYYAETGESDSVPVWPLRRETLSKHTVCKTCLNVVLFFFASCIFCKIDQCQGNADSVIKKRVAVLTVNDCYDPLDNMQVAIVSKNNYVRVGQV